MLNEWTGLILGVTIASIGLAIDTPWSCLLGGVIGFAVVVYGFMRGAS